MQNRAYSLLTVKKVDEELRIIRGIATTPQTDRVGDVVDPLGAEFKNPSPLLWMHRHDLPVGTVNFGQPTKDGIPFEARIPKVEEPSGLKARIDEAWASVKSGLVRAVSIGFRALTDPQYIQETGGFLFSSTEILELSLVTVPANSEATIQMIKSIDTKARTASGQTALDHIVAPSSGAPEKKTVKITLTPKEGRMNIKDQIKSYQNERAAKAARMEEIMKKSAESGETLDVAQEEEYDGLEKEIEAIDKHLNRLATLEKTQMAKAVPVNADEIDSTDKANLARLPHAQVTLKSKLEPGVAMARVVKSIGIAKGNLMAAAEIAAANYKEDNRIQNVLKAAVAAGSTTNATWAGNLVSEEGGVYADFVEFLRPQTILGKFGAGSIPPLRRVPFRVPLLGQTSGGQGYWVGEGKGKPVTSFDFARTTLEPTKVANIAVVTEELLRDSSPSADILIRDSLVAALRERLDIDFINPAKAAVAGVSPASITNGVTAIPSTGTTADDIRCDIAALMASYIAANNTPTTGVLIMNSTTALALSLLRNPLGQKEFGGITMMGGDLDGIPVIVSEYVPSDTTGSIVVMVNAQDIYLGDEGGFQVDMSREASLQMDNAPTQSSVATVTPTTVVSLWQTNSVGFRAERTISWAKRRQSAVAVLEGVNWGACA
ncbi:phage major capsid protein [Larkinella harenae]